MDFLHKNNISWVEDPSNKKDCYERNKVRNNINTSLIKTSRTNMDVDINLEFSNYGYIFLPTIKSINFLANVLMTIGATYYKPSLLKVQNACNSLKTAQRVSVNNCIILKQKNGYYIIKEVRKKPMFVSLKSSVQSYKILWNNFFCKVPSNLPIGCKLDSFIVDEFKQNGWHNLTKNLTSKQRKKLLQKLGLKNIMLYNLPAIWHGNNILYSPIFNNSFSNVLDYHYYPKRPITGKKLNF